MAVSDYIILPKDVAATARWFGWRSLIGACSGIAAAVGSSFLLSTELSVFMGIFVFWIIAGYSAKIFLGIAGVILIGIIALSVYDPEYEVGETVVIEWLARWVFYFLSAGIVLLLVEHFTHNKSDKKEPEATTETSQKAMPKTVEAQRSSERSQPNNHVIQKPIKKPVRKAKTVYTRPVHPAYTPTKQRIRPKPPKLIQG